jgi:uncharacterized protein YjiS (DUF1127 family)
MSSLLHILSGTGLRLQDLAPTLQASLRASLRAAAGGVLGLGRRTLRRWRQWGLDRTHARQWQELSEAALRDLGLTRSELRSVQVEADGLVEATRRRVQRLLDEVGRT